MLAVLIGSLALLAGLLLMLLPLLAPELTRARDGLWAAVVLLLALVLVTCADRLTGAPMLGVLCGGLLIGRLGTEVGQQRWAGLAEEQRTLLLQRDHWLAQLQLLLQAGSKLVAAGLSLLSWLRERLRKPQITKRWVREQAAEAAAEPAAEPTTSASTAPVEEPAQEQKPEPAAASEPSEMEASQAVEPEAVADAEPEPVAEVEPEAAAELEPKPEAEVEPERESGPEHQASSEPEPAATPTAEQELPLLEAEILDPTPQPQQAGAEPTLTEISSLDDVDALMEDGRSG
ncbi:MAG: Ycf66 family protein [Synechococcus sp.]|nr:Ycf66 family protein [Synechococcus sp.]